MKQLIARIDDDLHAGLKRRAAAEGRSLNALVSELLAAGALYDERALLRARARALGLLYEPVPDEPALPRDEVIEGTRGWGTSVSEALLADRRRR